jgi:signal transduction histidine kinase
MMKNQEQEKLRYDLVAQSLFLRLMPGIIHEINNPLGVLLNNNESLKDYTSFLISYIDQNKASKNKDDIERKNDIKEDCPVLSQEMDISIERIMKVMQGLHLLTAQDEHSQAQELNKILDKVLDACWNEIKYTLTITKEYGALKVIEGNATQLALIIMLFTLNVVYQIEGNAKMKIQTHCDKDNVFIVLIDNRGSSKPQEVSLLDKIELVSDQKKVKCIRVLNSDKEVKITSVSAKNDYINTLEIPIS